MAIQNRRGDYKDFDPNQMVPGEFAVSNSEGNKRLFLCFARPGDVIEIPTVESIVDTHEVEEIRDEALEAKDQAVEAAEIAKYNTFTSLSATVDNSVGTPNVSVVKLSDAPNNSFRFDFRNLKGAQGIQGIQGVSVVDSYIDDNNHLIIVYSDSTQANPHTDDAGNIGLNVVPLTKAQYDALTDEEKMDPEIFYWITDVDGGTYGMVISGGTSNYNELENKPSINGVTLQGNITASTLGIGGVTDYPDLTNKPQINGVTLQGNMNTSDLNIQDVYMSDVTVEQTASYASGTAGVQYVRIQKQIVSTRGTYVFYGVLAPIVECDQTVEVDDSGEISAGDFLDKFEVNIRTMPTPNDLSHFNIYRRTRNDTGITLTNVKITVCAVYILVR